MLVLLNSLHDITVSINSFSIAECKGLHHEQFACFDKIHIRIYESLASFQILKKVAACSFFLRHYFSELNDVHWNVLHVSTLITVIPLELHLMKIKLLTIFLHEAHRKCFDIAIQVIIID